MTAFSASKRARSSASISAYTLRSVRSARKIERITSQKISPTRIVGITEYAALAQKFSITLNRIRRAAGGMSAVLHDANDALDD